MNPECKLVPYGILKGVRLTKKAMKPYENRIERSNILPKWYVTIPPPI